MRVLVTGWFSFEGMGTTAGDLMCKDVVCRWLNEAGIGYNVAANAELHINEAVDWQQVNAAMYTDVIFVCGPFGNGWPVTELLEKFSHCRLTGMNLSLLQRLEEWNPFDLLYERDNFYSSYPDLAMAAEPRKVPVVGVIYAHKQKEYGQRALHDTANEAISKLIESRDLSIVPIDTAIVNNKYGLNTADQIESLISIMDVVVTTRLHGTVLAIKHHVPVIAIDPIAGGAKVSLQAKALDWPLVFGADTLEYGQLQEAFDFCLTPQARREAIRCSSRALEIISSRKRDFIGQMRNFGENLLKENA